MKKNIYLFILATVAVAYIVFTTYHTFIKQDSYTLYSTEHCCYITVDYDDVDDYDNIAIKYRDFYYDETTVEYVPNTEIEETINSMQEFCYHHHNEGE